MKKNQIDFITMGCSKNLVDSEQLMRQLPTKVIIVCMMANVYKVR